MLLNLIRLVFVSLCLLVGLSSGRLLFEKWAGASLPAWFGGAIGLGVSMTIILMEQAFRRQFTRNLIALLLGLAGGLVLSFLLLSILDQVIQDADLRATIDVPLALVVTYLIIVTAVRNVDRFRVVVPFVEFRNERIDNGSLVLSASALRDGRLAGLLEAGLLDGRVLVHRRVLIDCEARAGDDDPLRRSGGQRALATLASLAASLGERFAVVDDELAVTETLSDLVVAQARLEGAKLVVSDSELASRARTEGLRVLDIGQLASVMVPSLLAGERIEVTIERAGDEADQGIGHLDDGSMVVVTGAGERVGQQLACVVLRQHRTSAGRMVFCDIEASD